TALHGRVPAGTTFTAWIRALLAERAKLADADLRAGALQGARALLATGTTLVGDIDSTGALVDAGRAAGRNPPRVRRDREVLDAGDPARARAALKRLDPAPSRAPRLLEGISPHAPYTISPALWAELSRRCRARRAHVMIHFAETREEGEWLEHGRGPMS